MNVIEIKNISKKYGDSVVLDNISINIKKGEIHAILGENGAGKSTLMNILCGMPIIEKTGGFEGEIYIEGEKVNIVTPKDALNFGIGIAKQELAIINDITVWENIFLNDEITNKNIISKIFGKNFEFIDEKSMINKSNEIMESMKNNIKANDVCNKLSIGEKHFIEIAREIKRKKIKVIIFDEPTSAFTENESKVFGEIIRNISKSGVSIIFITHKLDEVIKYSDRITVLRNGKNEGTFDNKNITKEKLAELMIGNNQSQVFNKKDKIQCDEIIMSLKNVTATKGNESIEDISVDIYKGEIIGVAGVSGQGRGVFGDVLGGLINYKGDIYINGTKLKNGDSEYAIKNGIAYVSDDRKGTGLYLAGSIYENICTSAMYINNKFIKKIGFINFANKKEMKKYTEKCIKDLNIKCENPSQKVGELSGGNQQKVCIAKALALNPSVLVVSEVTRGIDILAKKNILETLVNISKEKGLTIIMISSDLNELRKYCERIIILNDKKLRGILASSEPSEKFGLAISEGSEKN